MSMVTATGDTSWELATFSLGKGEEAYRNVWDAVRCRAIRDEQELLSLLEAGFTTDLVTKVRARYGMHDDYPFGPTDLQAIMIGIGAQVEECHLKERLKVLCKENESWKFAPREVHQLSESQVNALVAHFRPVNSHGEYDQLYITDDESRFNLLPYGEEVKADLKILRKFDLYRKFRYEHGQEHATSEFFGHEVAYQKTSSGQLVPALLEDGSLAHLRVVRRIDKAGLVFTIMLPIREPLPDEPQKMVLLFRGTKCWSSMLRLLESGGIGEKTFRQAQQMILDEIVVAIPEAGKHVEVSLHGHSQGGGDVGRCLELLLTALLQSRPQLVEKEEDDRIVVSLEAAPRIRRIRVIEAGLWESTGVSRETALNLAHLVRQLNDPLLAVEERGEWSEIMVPTDKMIQISVVQHKVGGDPVQRLGEFAVGALMSASGVTRTVIKYDQGHEGFLSFIFSFFRSGLQAHRTKNYEEPGMLAFEEWTEIDREELERELNDQLLGGSRIWGLNSVAETVGDILKGGYTTSSSQAP